MHPFPSIEQFSSVRKYAIKKEIGVLSYRGTTKLHGTHADVVQSRDGAIHYQLRNNVITVEKHNCVFAAFASCVDWTPLFSQVFAAHPTAEKVMLSGEFCGGNIQKGVVIAGLPKMFCIFGIAVISKDIQWVDIAAFNLTMSEKQVFSVLEFGVWTMDIDFTRAEDSQNRLVKFTNDVELCCPAGKAFGVEGVGEGIVWQAVSAPHAFNPALTFKVKGTKHSTTRVKVLVEIDLELAKNADALVELVLGEPRLLQGLDHLREQGKEATIENVGAFTKWIVGDVAKEEGDRILESGFTGSNLRVFNTKLTKRAKVWYVAQLKQ